VLRLKARKGLWQVKGCQGSNQRGICAIVFKTRVLWNDCVDWYRLLFWRERGFCRLGFWPINVDFKMSKGLLVHL